MGYLIRRAGPKDVGRINELFTEMLRTIHGKCDSQACIYGDLDDCFVSDDNVIYVAEDGGAIVAFLSVEGHHEGDISYVYLNDFSVTAAYRSKGIGTQLLQSAETYARERHYPIMVLHAEAFNLRALQFYERHGFQRDEQTGSRLRMIRTL